MRTDPTRPRVLVRGMCYGIGAGTTIGTAVMALLSALSLVGSGPHPDAAVIALGLTVAALVGGGVGAAAGLLVAMLALWAVGRYGVQGARPAVASAAGIAGAAPILLVLGLPTNPREALPVAAAAIGTALVAGAVGWSLTPALLRPRGPTGHPTEAGEPPPR